MIPPTVLYRIRGTIEYDDDSRGSLMMVDGERDLLDSDEEGGDDTPETQARMVRGREEREPERWTGTEGGGGHTDGAALEDDERDE